MGGQLARRTSKGWTLVELLVVIGIIALLIAILLPVLTRAREQAKRVICISNERQLTLAWLAYANENHGFICSSNTQPLSSDVPQNNKMLDDALALPSYNKAAFWSWIADGPDTHDIRSGKLWPYVKDLEVYFCPNDPVRPNTVYSINGYLAGPVGNPYTLVSLRQIKHSESTFVFIEALAVISSDNDQDFGDSDDYSAVGPIHGGFRTPLYPMPYYLQLPGYFHPLGGVHGSAMSFADGHAIFWQYADPNTSAMMKDVFKKGAAQRAKSPDLFQLEAWSGGPLPPTFTH